VPGSSARSTFGSERTRLGTVRYGDVGRQGNAPSPVELLPIQLRRQVGANPVAVSAQTAGGVGSIDALLVMPEVATLLTDGGGHFTALLTSKAPSTERRSLSLGGSGRAMVSSYDSSGRLVDQRTRAGSEIFVSIAPGGFTIATR